MAKLSKREKEKIHLDVLQMTGGPDRGPTWVGCRPSVMLSKKYNKKATRRQGKAECRAYC